MKKLLLLALFLVAILFPVTAFAATRTIQPTLYYACEAPTTAVSIKAGDIDPNSITQDDTLDCSGDVNFTSKVQWNATGVKGDTGDQGIQGPKGDTGDQGTQGPIGLTGPQGPAGIDFTHIVCSETGLSGPQAQENALFCLSGVAPDGGIVYKAAIAAASYHVLVGIPTSASASVDWGGLAITYVTFTSGFHAEYHADGIVRIYNTLNQHIA